MKKLISIPIFFLIFSQTVAFAGTKIPCDNTLSQIQSDGRKISDPDLAEFVYKTFGLPMVWMQNI